jgi:hypothetical protein
MNINAIGARSILSDENISYAIMMRISNSNLYRVQNFWLQQRYRYQNLENADVFLLENLRRIKTKYANIVKVRVEEPNVQIYSENEEMLKEIVKEFNTVDLDFISKITGPESGTENILLNNSIIVKTDPGFKYKLTLRTGQFDINTKHQLLNYIDNLDNQVYCNAAGRNALASNHKSVYTAPFLLVNDLSLAVFINLISPGVVTNIHELVYNN